MNGVLRKKCDYTNRTAATICAKDVGEDSSEILVLRQFIDHFCQAARGNFKEEGQMFGEASVDQELGQWDRNELQQSEKPNTTVGLL